MTKLLFLDNFNPYWVNFFQMIFFPDNMTHYKGTMFQLIVYPREAAASSMDPCSICLLFQTHYHYYRRQFGRDYFSCFLSSVSQIKGSFDKIRYVWKHEELTFPFISLLGLNTFFGYVQTFPLYAFFLKQPNNKL